MTDEWIRKMWYIYTIEYYSAIKKNKIGVPVMTQWLTNLTRNHEVAVRSLALLSGLMIQRCRELWCSLQTRLGSCVAVALV